MGSIPSWAPEFFLELISLSTATAMGATAMGATAMGTTAMGTPAMGTTDVEKPWLALGGPFFSFCTNGLRKGLLAWPGKMADFDHTAKQILP